MHKNNKLLASYIVIAVRECLPQLLDPFLSLSVFLDVINEAIGAGIMASRGCGTLQLGLDDLGQLLAQLNTG